MNKISPSRIYKKNTREKTQCLCIKNLQYVSLFYTLILPFFTNNFRSNKCKKVKKTESLPQPREWKLQNEKILTNWNLSFLLTWTLFTKKQQQQHWKIFLHNFYALNPFPSLPHPPIVFLFLSFFSQISFFVFATLSRSLLSSQPRRER